MMHDFPALNRREWMQAAAGAVSLTAFPMSLSAAADAKRPKVAAIITEFTYRSHAHVILENFLEPYYFNGQLTESGIDIVSMYADQFPKGDMARAAAKTYGFPIYPTIAEALRCGGDKLAVDGVLSIGEHGNYPVNERGQKMYPRKRFFDEIVQVFRADGRVVPLFSDKHLSYRRDWAAEMVSTAQELKIPFMAGSSVPLAQRRPPLEIPAGSAIEEAVSIHSGPMEIYDFHGLEVLQSMVESRRGGETGVKDIQFLEGDAVWQAAADGRWDRSLADAAMNADSNAPPQPLHDFVEPADGKRHPAHAILVTYRDGLKGTVLRIGSDGTRWKFACRLKDQPQPLATSLYVGPWENRNLFKALSHAIQSLIHEKKSPYPVERTLLTSVMLDIAMDSRFQQHKQLATPQLAIAYQPTDFRAMREMGATWKIITEGMPQPQGIDPGGPKK